MLPRVRVTEALQELSPELSLQGLKEARDAPAQGLRAAGVDWVSLEPGGWHRRSGKDRCTLSLCCTVSWVCSVCASKCYTTNSLFPAGQYRAQANQITEALPPEVRVKDDLSLPPTINSYPFSSFIKSHFQVRTPYLHCLPTGQTH